VLFRSASKRNRLLTSRSLTLGSGNPWWRGAKAWFPERGKTYTIHRTDTDRITMDFVEAVDLRRAPALLGRHNWQNAAAGYAAARLLGQEPAEIAKAIYSFPGLPHRMEEVGRVGSVRFINDSKATNAGSTRQALASFENSFWIAGGRAKGGAFEELTPLMPRVAKAYLIGESAETLAAQLKGRVIAEICRDLKTAVAHASADAAKSTRADPVVLLSPSCASFDQFDNYEHRGESFREYVHALPGAAISGEAA